MYEHPWKLKKTKKNTVISTKEAKCCLKQTDLTLHWPITDDYALAVIGFTREKNDTKQELCSFFCCFLCRTQWGHFTITLTAQHWHRNGTVFHVSHKSSVLSIFKLSSSMDIQLSFKGSIGVVRTLDFFIYCSFYLSKHYALFRLILTTIHIFV